MNRRETESRVQGNLEEASGQGSRCSRGGGQSRRPGGNEPSGFWRRAEGLRKRTIEDNGVGGTCRFLHHIIDFPPAPAPTQPIL